MVRVDRFDGFLFGVVLCCFVLWVVEAKGEQKVQVYLTL